MKGYVVVFCGLVFLAGAAGAQQVPPDWDTNPPGDTAGVKYRVGVSVPSATEQEAFKGAWQNVLQNFASSIATRVESLTDISVHEEGYDSGIADAYTVYVETSSFSTQVPLSGVREAARKIEHRGGAYTARVLGAMSAGDYQKALRGRLQRREPGRTGELPPRSPHRPGRAQLRHPVPPLGGAA